eukprot:gene14107-biopygen7001
MIPSLQKPPPVICAGLPSAARAHFGGCACATRSAAAAAPSAPRQPQPKGGHPAMMIDPQPGKLAATPRRNVADDPDAPALGHPCPASPRGSPEAAGGSFGWAAPGSMSGIAAGACPPELLRLLPSHIRGSSAARRPSPRRRGCAARPRRAFLFSACFGRESRG